MNQYDLSVCILTYHSNDAELMTTVSSVFGQKGITFEIIIADDGSPQNYFARLESFFYKKGFSDYKLIPHEKNQGTVKNCCDALKRAEGYYTKLISPGDYLAHENTLESIVSFMKKSRARASFSDLIYYKKEKLHEPFTDLAMPQDVEAYHHRNLKDQKLNYLVLADKVCGASWVTETEVLRTYLDQISGRVIYSEDSVYRLMVADGIPLVHQPLASVFYQLGEGISTSGSKAWQEKLYRDDTETNEILVDKLKKTGGSKKLIRYLQVEKEHNRKKTNLVKGILFPGAVIRWVRNRKNPRYTEPCENFHFIDACCLESTRESAEHT